MSAPVREPPAALERLKPVKTSVGVGCALLLLLFWAAFVAFCVAVGWYLLLLILVPLSFMFLGMFLEGVRRTRNPRPVLAVSSPNVHPGQVLTVEYSLQGGSHEALSLALLLIGEESATNSGGDSTSTQSNTFLERTLLALDFPVRNEVGGLSTVIPSDAMHTLELGSSKIAWWLEARVQGAAQSDVRFPLVVEPAVVEEGKSVASATPSGPWTTSAGIHLLQKNFRPGDLVEGSIAIADSRLPNIHAVQQFCVRLVHGRVG